MGLPLTIQSIALYALTLLALLQIYPILIRVYLQRNGSDRVEPLKMLLLFIAAIALLFRILPRKPIPTVNGVVLTGNLRNDVLARCVYLAGAYEPNLVAYMTARLKPDDIFLDIGANSGHFSLIAAKLGAKVISVEASPANCKLFTQNVEANSLGANIRLIPAAAGSHQGEIIIRECKRNGMWSATSPQAFKSMAFLCKKIRVPQVKMDDILSEDDIKKIRFVKIDVEGAELEVLRGLTKLIETRAADLEFCIEFSPHWLSPEEAQEIFTIFEANGYDAYRLQNIEIDFPPHNIRDKEPFQEIPKRQVDLIFSRATK